MIRLLLLPTRAIVHDALLSSQFPSVELMRALPGPGCRHAVVDVSAWRSPTRDPWMLDAAVGDAAGPESFAIELRAEPDDDVTLDALQILTRAQWAIGRRNRHSNGAVFDAVLERHRGLHDLGKPLVHADWLHALDTWQWLLRLRPDAPLALQVAALFHDVERLVSESDERIEHLAPDYLAFKQAHARTGARLLEVLLAGLLDGRTLARAAALVRDHEQPGKDPALALLNDADALSFFSRNCTGYWMHFGPAQTARKVDYTLRRMSAEARRRLQEVWLPPAIDGWVRRWQEPQEGLDA